MRVVRCSLLVETTLTPNLILSHNLRNIARVVPRGSGNPAALLVAGKRQECRFYDLGLNIELLTFN